MQARNAHRFFITLLCSCLPILCLGFPAQDLESGFIKVEGDSLYYESKGNGPPIVLLHDGMLHSEAWDPVCEYFARDYQVTRYDRRGYGRSSIPTKPFSNIDDLNRVFESLQIPPAILFGASAGGELAIDFTLKHPDKVKMLVLVGSIVSGMEATNHFYTRGGRLTPEIVFNPESFRKYFLEDDPWEFYAENIAAREQATLLLNQYPHNLDLQKQRLIQGARRDALPNLHEITVPVLIVTGEYDIPDVHAQGGAIYAGVKNARRTVIPKAGHLVALEQPEPFIREVETFMVEEPIFVLIKTESPAAATRYCQKLWQAQPGKFLFTENRMNILGYQCLQQNQVTEAIQLFQLNVQGYPNSANTYDSLGEAYLAASDTLQAIANYQKSLALNPQNENAQQVLESLKE